MKTYSKKALYSIRQYIQGFIQKGKEKNVFTHRLYRGLTNDTL